MKDEQLYIVEDFNFEQPKTKEFINILKALDVNGKKILLLTNGTLNSVYKSGRNIPKVKILEANKASTYDILNNQILLIQKSALDIVQNSFAKKEKVVS